FADGNPEGGPAAAGRAGESDASGNQQVRRKRKRRRGRKPFARDNRPPERNDAAADGTAPAAQAPEPVRPPAPRVSAVPAQVDKPWESRRKRAHGDQPVYAALDLGTNNCRLLVAIPGRPGQFRVIDAFSRIVRLGEGLTASGRLADAAMDRAIEALKVCATKLSTREVRARRLIATEACRAAANGAEFLARVKDETGLELEIIDRETEARLAVSGCGSLVERGTEAVVLFDIGGGSSEIALIDVS